MAPGDSEEILLLLGSGTFSGLFKVFDGEGTGRYPVV